MPKPKVIVVSGVPGTGKTVIAKKLAKELGFRYLSIHNLNKSIYSGYDKERKTRIVDTDKMTAVFQKFLNASKDKGIIFESHLAHHLPKKLVKLCVILTTNIKVLKARLAKRRYSQQKIEENLQAEIFESILTEAQENKHKVLKVDTTKFDRIKFRKLVSDIKKSI
ncbi:AAA family ATPase [Candidatus Woesearchaeota archaeon]|nr:AAA family ATPase [Candidatus Woesearchaeota archaeon]